MYSTLWSDSVSALYYTARNRTSPCCTTRVVTKIFVFVISRKFREILISCFAKFSSSFAKFSRNTKSKFGRNFRDFAKFFDEIFVISRNINQFLLKFNKILIITPYLVDWICRLTKFEEKKSWSVFLTFKKPKRLLKSKKQWSLCKFTFKKLYKVAVISNFLTFFKFLVDIFTLLDPDPGRKMNAGPCGSGSTALV